MANKFANTTGGRAIRAIKERQAKWGEPVKDTWGQTNMDNSYDRYAVKKKKKKKK